MPSRMRDNLRVYRIAWSKITGNRIDWRELLFLLLFFLLLLRWRRCLICEISRSSGVLVRMLPLLSLCYLCPSISIPFFAVPRPPRQFRDIWTRVVLSARHPLAQRRNYVGPRDALGPRLKKIEITPVANGSPLDPAAFPWDLTPSDDYDPRPSSILLRPSTDVIGTTKEILRAQIGGSLDNSWPSVNIRYSYIHYLSNDYLLSYWAIRKEIFKVRSKSINIFYYIIYYVQVYTRCL